MCMEDIQLGRSLAPGIGIVACNQLTPTVLVGPDPMRTRIVFGCNGGDTIFIAPDGFTPATFQGFIINATFPTWVCRIEDYGRLVTGRWQAITQAGASGVMVITTSLEKL